MPLERVAATRRDHRDFDSIRDMRRHGVPGRGGFIDGPGPVIGGGWSSKFGIPGRRLWQRAIAFSVDGNRGSNSRKRYSYRRRVGLGGARSIFGQKARAPS